MDDGDDGSSQFGQVDHGFAVLSQEMPTTSSSPLDWFDLAVPEG